MMFMLIGLRTTQKYTNQLNIGWDMYSFRRLRHIIAFQRWWLQMTVHNGVFELEDCLLRNRRQVAPIVEAETMPNECPRYSLADRSVGVDDQVAD